MDETSKDKPESDTPFESKGLFIVEGSQLTIPAGGLSLSIGEDGSLTGELNEVLMSVDMVSPWIGISLDHLSVAQAANGRVVRAEAGDDGDLLGQSLREEMASSMQAIVAAATALEAFYLAVRERSDLPEELLKKWRSGRRRRSGHVAEVLRRAVRLSNQGTQNLKLMVKELYRFRGWAVHPPGGAKRPVFRPEIARGVEWRYQAFQFSNARLLVRAVLAIIAQVAERAEKAMEPELRNYLEARTESVKPHVDRWGEEFGPLLEAETPAGSSDASA